MKDRCEIAAEKDQAAIASAFCSFCHFLVCLLFNQWRHRIFISFGNCSRKEEHFGTVEVEGANQQNGVSRMMMG